MKKVLSVLVAAIMLAALCVPAFAADQAITITANKSTLKVGETVTVSVNVTNLSGITAEVHYDTDVFERVNVVDTGKMALEVNKDNADYVRLACVTGTKLVTDTVLTLELKYKGGDGKITLDVEDALAGSDETITALCGTAVKTLTITEKASEATTAKKPAEQPTKKPATTKAPSKGNVSKVNNPKSGGTVSVAASAAAVVVMAAAVAYTMKKKNED